MRQNERDGLRMFVDQEVGQSTGVDELESFEGTAAFQDGKLTENRFRALFTEGSQDEIATSGMAKDQSIFFSDFLIKAFERFLDGLDRYLVDLAHRGHETFDVVVFHFLEDLSGHFVAQDVEQTAPTSPIHSSHQIFRTVPFPVLFN